MANESVIEVDEIGGYAKIIKPPKKNGGGTVAPEAPTLPIHVPTSRSSTLGRERKIPIDMNPTAFRSSTLPRKPELPTTTNVSRFLCKKRPVSFDCCDCYNLCSVGFVF
jgi:hypothetical protein